MINSQLAKNVFSLLVLQGGQYILPLITFPYLARVLGPANFGVLGFVFAIAQYCTLFTDYGFNLTATKQIAENRDDKQKISHIFWTTMTSKTVLLGVVLVGLALSVAFVPALSDVGLVMIFAGVQVAGSVMLPAWLFQGIERLWAVTVSSLAARATAVPLIFMFVHNPEDLWIAAMIQSSTSIISGIIACIFVRHYRAIAFAAISPADVKEAFRDGFPIFIATIAISLYTMSTTVMLGMVSTHTQTGLFNASDKIRNAITSAFLVLGNAFFPRVNVLLKESEARANAFLRKLMIGQCALTLLISLALFLFAPLITELALGDQYANATPIIQVLAPLIFLVSTSMIFGNYMLLPYGYRRIYTQVPAIMAVVHLVALVPMAHYYGAMGGAITLLTTETVIFFALAVALIRNGILGNVMRGEATTHA
ncbi:O-antigen/teichoic acid export membrane protein [Kushneria sinocarnis]|uniref:O-antigen/teichoic acid export membrane protein n=1 Tax=Kushneria sinocarnis TaxID=595502 RepID=A0A420WVY6_9GAMM|nr:flippase [Kushneria sinocarnis]RKR03250.1 O-antigen/teichoic acid export membrane protein [Kushneria sinocarnis]